MHIEARLFEFLTAFFVLSAVVYGVLTAMFQYGGIEWAGVTALVMTAGLTLITGTFFRFVARRLDTRPEDYEDAEISDGAGELGFFSPHSWWPVMIALSASVTAVGVALWLPWLIVAGTCFVLATAARNRASRFNRVIRLGNVAGARSAAYGMSRRLSSREG